MAQHFIQISYGLIVLLIASILTFLFRQHKERQSNSDKIAKEIFTNLSDKYEAADLVNYFAFITIFLGGMRHKYLVSLILKFAAGASILFNLHLSSLLNDTLFQITGVISLIFVIWMVYTDWIYSAEINKYEYAFMDAVATYLPKNDA